MSRQTILVLAVLALLTMSLSTGPAVRPLIAADKPAAGTTKTHPDAAKTGTAEAGHDEAAKKSPIEAEPELAIWTVVVFLVLMAVLWPLAWKPLIQAMHQREEQMEHTLAEAERARSESERLLAEHRNQMAQAAEQSRAILDEARRAAEASANEIIQRAQAEAEAAQHRAQREIVAARDQALNEIFTKTADLAVSVAGRVLGRELGQDDHRRLVEVAMSELPSGPKAANGREGHG